ncbi:hypothetical protein TNCT_222231 [Trichonephila clavata]|uniref:Uncharacterized protein n=1 Tax=Trichonephila clavata TaxID=2740835 RepID=A0A8X6FJ44_TRICU|nr:hypothetical protein TNCT_222231 [Trichonephila clavata]
MVFIAANVLQQQLLAEYFASPIEHATFNSAIQIRKMKKKESLCLLLHLTPNYIFGLSAGNLKGLSINRAVNERQPIALFYFILRKNAKYEFENNAD